MKAVYFGRSLVHNFPGAFPCLCMEPEVRWVGVQDLLDAMERGEAVSVRPATWSELQRAEELLALAEIGEELSRKIGAIVTPGTETDSEGA